jgi:hypothetical protein
MIAPIKSRIPVAGRGSIYHLNITLAEAPGTWRSEPRLAATPSTVPAWTVLLESVVNLAVFVQKWPKIQHFS